MSTDKEYRGEMDIPEPFEVKGWKDYIRFLFGPGVVALGLGVGTGEIISAPFLVVKMGPTLLWIATISVLLQTITSISASKYTILTGEPIQLGINRLWLGKKAWTVIWVIFRTIQMMWPYYMALTGSTLAALFIGQVPGQDQRLLWSVLSVIGIIICTLPLLIGKKVMDTLAKMFFWLHMVIVIPLFIILAIIYVPGSTLLEVFKGFFSFGTIPANGDWMAMAAVAGYAGLQAYAGMTISSYYRDSEWGMAKRVGYIPGLVGGKEVNFQVNGYLPKVTQENKTRASKWYSYIRMELWPIFFFGSLVTMLFPAALYYKFVPTAAAKEAGFGFTSLLAHYMSSVFPAAWMVLLITLFAVFWPDGTATIDSVLREFTNIIWNSFPSLYKRFKGDVRPLYYGILVIFTVIWLVMIAIGTQPLIMTLLAGAFANLSGFIFALGLLGVNYVLIPKEYRFSTIEVIIICIAVLFYGFFFISFILNQFLGITF